MIPFVRHKRLLLSLMLTTTLGAFEVVDGLSDLGVDDFDDLTSDTSLSGLLNGDGFRSGNYGSTLSSLLGDQSNKFLGFPLNFQCDAFEGEVEPIDICDMGRAKSFEVDLGVCTMSGDDSYYRALLNRLCSDVTEEVVSEAKAYAGYEVLNSYIGGSKEKDQKGDKWLDQKLPNGKSYHDTYVGSNAPLNPENALSKSSPIRSAMLNNDYRSFSLIKRCIETKKWTDKTDAYEQCSHFSIVSSEQLRSKSQKERDIARSPAYYEQQKRDALALLKKDTPTVSDVAKSGAYEANQINLTARQSIKGASSSAAMVQATTKADMDNFNMIYGRDKNGKTISDSDYNTQYQKIIHSNRMLKGLEDTAYEEPKLMFPSQQALEGIKPEKRAKYLYLYNKQKAKEILDAYRWDRRAELQMRLLSLSAAKGVADSKQYYPLIAKKRVEELLKRVDSAMGGGSSGGVASAAGDLF